MMSMKFIYYSRRIFRIYRFYRISSLKKEREHLAIFSTCMNAHSPVCIFSWSLSYCFRLNVFHIRYTHEFFSSMIFFKLIYFFLCVRRFELAGGFAVFLTWYSFSFGLFSGICWHYTPERRLFLQWSPLNEITTNRMNHSILIIFIIILAYTAFLISKFKVWP